MKYAIAITLILISFLLVSCNESPKSPEEACKYSGGEWKTFPNGCADKCSFIRSDELIFCTQALIDSCDCGDDSCWTGEVCEPN